MSLENCTICSKQKKGGRAQYKKLSEKCHSVLPTIIDMIRFCVPSLKVTGLSIDNIICNKCLSTLKTCVDFIEQCLSVFKEKNSEEKMEAVNNDLLKFEDIKGTTDSSAENITRDLIEEALRGIDTGQILSENEENGTIDDGANVHIETENNFVSEPEKPIETPIKKSKYLCEICSTSIKFRTLRLWKNHMQKVHSINCEFSCKKCGRKFTSQVRLEQHEQLFKDQDTCVLKCERCDKKFKCKSELLKHQEKVRDAPSCDFETCPICSQKFSKESYKEHMSVHPKKICEICGEGFSNMGAFFRHKISHNEPNQAICPVCGKGFTHPQKLSVHLRYTHEYGERKFLCSKCPKRFYTNQKLNLHLKRHDNIKDIPCPDCDKMFLSKTLLQTHYKAVHLNLRPHLCPYSQCNKKFARQQHLQKHLETHNRRFPGRGAIDGIYSIAVENPGLPGKCHHCGRIFKNLYQLKQHIKTVHVRIRRFKCEYCDMRFICKHTQMKHQDKHKDPYYEFRCKICFKHNSSQIELEEHSRKHTKLAFNCKICNENFGRSYLLENHMLSRHPNVDAHVPQLIMDEALENLVFISDAAKQ